MIIDYIGQEIIWNLRCNNPYCANWRHYSIVIKCISPQENAEAVQFIFSHIEPEYIIDVVKEKNRWHTKETEVVKEIYIKNVFEEVSRVVFYNDFDDINRKYKELGV